MMHDATNLASPFFMDYANTFTLDGTIAQEGFDLFTRASEEHFPVLDSRNQVRSRCSRSRYRCLDRWSWADWSWLGRV